MKVITLPLSLSPEPGAQRPAQRGVHTAQHTLQLPGNPQHANISAPSVGCSLLTAVWLVRHMYKSVGKLEGSRFGRLFSTQKRPGAAPATHHRSFWVSIVPCWTLYRYVPRLCVFRCCLMLAGANILTVLCLLCCC